MQTPPPPPPHRRDSLEPRQQQLDQLKSEIRTKIANYQRNAILERITKPCQTEVPLNMSDTSFLSLLDKLSLSSELSRSTKENPASTNKWPPSPTLAHLPDVTNHTYTVPNTEPRNKQWLPRQQLGHPREPNSCTPIGPDPNHHNYSVIGPRPRYLPNTGLIPNQKEMK